MQYFSEFYKLPLTGNEIWFDPRMDKDTKLYIDPFFVFKSELPIFINARQKFLDFFHVAFELAHEAKRSIAAHKKLEIILRFPEVMEIRLGDSQGKYGAGPGTKFAKACAKALVQLAEKGYKGLDHFEEIEIFTKGIGPDGISDAAANILKYELIQYTQEICKDFSIPTKKFGIENAQFDFQNGFWDCAISTFSLPENPCLQNKGILLVPKEFLCAIYTIGSDRFSEYAISRKSDELRALLNYEIEKSLSKSAIKTAIKDIAKTHPRWIREYIDYIENEADVKPYDLEVDTNNLYRNEKKTHSFVISHPMKLSASDEQGFLQCIEILINQFKFFIEEQDGYKLLWDTSDAEPNCQPRNEFTVISLFTNVVLGYCQANNIALNEESEVGRGIVDFRFPSGYQKRALMNLKLARNSKFLGGKLDKISNYISSYNVDYRYFLITSYTTKEVEFVDKALAEIATMDSGEVHFRPIVINANLPAFSISTSLQPKQMSNDRLRTIEENLELLRKQVAGKEKAKILAPFEEQARIELGIQELRKLIRPFEDEYWKLLTVRSAQVEIPEAEAEVVVAELVEQVGQLQKSGQYPDEMLQILQQIYTEVSKPDTPAAAKLKGALSMFPPFVSLGYEVEIDTENFFLTYLPTFAKWYKALARK